MAQMVLGFLDRLARDARKCCVGRGAKTCVEFGLPGVEQELAHDGVREIAIGLLAEQQVAEIPGVAKEGERVCVAPLALAARGLGQQQVGLAGQVECHVGERDVLFQLRRVPAPFGHAMAQHQARIAQPQQVLEEVRIRHRQMFFTSGGIS